MINFAKPIKLIKNFFKSNTQPLMMTYKVNAGFIPLDNWYQSADQGLRILSEGCHFIDTMTFLTDSKPISVYASSIRSRNHLVRDKDTVAVVINYENGSVGNLIYTGNCNKLLDKEIIEIDSDNKSAKMINFRQVDLYLNNKKTTTKFNGDKGHKDQILNFIDSIKSNKESPISFNDIYTTSLVTLKIIDSLRNGASQEI